MVPMLVLLHPRHVFIMFRSNNVYKCFYHSTTAGASVTGKEVTEQEVPDFSVVPESLIKILELIQPSTSLMRTAELMIFRKESG
jgi:hypothetical protein